MLPERKHCIPEAVECKKMDGFSVLLLKPETALLNEDEVEKLRKVLEGHFSAKGEPIYLFFVLLDSSMAEEIWDSDVNSYLWTDEYYNHMASGLCEVIILRGQDTASSLKKQIRETMSDSIDRIKENLGLDFFPDIAHGSDLGRETEELRIIYRALEKNKDS